MRLSFLVATVILAAGLTIAGAQERPPGELAGKVELLEKGGKSRPAPDAVVWLPGLWAKIGSHPEGHAITSFHKRFEPHVLPVEQGATVDFPNRDHIFHNVFSLTPGEGFDLGLYRNGASRQVRFVHPGLVRVYCDIHPQMAAYVVVVNGDFFARTDREGRFRLRNIPAGRHRAETWQESGGQKEIEIDVKPGHTTALDVRLDASEFRPLAHKNKYGKDYPPATEDDDRY